jgi:hypothetical protein
MTRCTAAASGSAFAALQARTQAGIGKRLATIDKLETGVKANKNLTDDLRAALTAKLDAAANGLQQLQAKVGSDTTLADQRADAHAMYANFRIYALVQPQVHEAERLAGQSAHLAAYQSQAASDQAAIQAATAAGQDTTAATTALNSATTSLDAVQGRLSGQMDSLLALAPTEYNANQSVLSAYTDLLHSDSADLTAARQSLGAVRQAL